MDVKPRLLFSLGRHSKQAGDECDLTHDVPFFHPLHLSLPDHIHDLISLQGSHALSIEKKPSPGLTRRLMKQ